VVDENGRLVDVYARADVILLAANNTYRRVSLSEFTVAQALAVGRAPTVEAQRAAAAAAAAHAAGTYTGSHFSLTCVPISAQLELLCPPYNPD
jgi:hypothetical protein